MVAFSSESDPLDEMKTLLEDNWVAFRDITTPQIIIPNETDNTVSRMDLNLGDTVVIKMDGTETLKQRANFKYYDRLFPIIIEIYTKHSRQRMRDLGKMLRMIINDNIHSFPSYQLMRYRGYSEAIEENLNIWRSTFRIQLESNAVCVESLET